MKKIICALVLGLELALYTIQPAFSHDLENAVPLPSVVEASAIWCSRMRLRRRRKGT